MVPTFLYLKGLTALLLFTTIMPDINEWAQEYSALDFLPTTWFITNAVKHTKPKTVCEMIKHMESRHKEFLKRKYPAPIEIKITTRKKQKKDWKREINTLEIQRNCTLDSLTYTLLRNL